MIHVCLSLYDKLGTYSKFTGTAILSIFENTTANVTIHLLHDKTLTADSRDKFSYVAGQYGQAVNFYNVEELCTDRLAEIVRLIPTLKTTRVTVGAMYRLLAPQVLPAEVDKLIYLDSDIIVNLDIKELWQIELGEKILAAVPEILNGVNSKEMFSLCRGGFVKPEDYFNSGVLLINLNLFRAAEEKILGGLLFRAKNPRYQDFFDQNVLNYCFAADALKLPLKFNRFIGYARRANEFDIERKIYHYAGDGLEMDMRDPFNRLWLKYFVKTPWFNGGTVEKLYANFVQMRAALKNSMIEISAAMSGKTRAFFTTPNNVDVTKKVFHVRDDEEIFLAENQSSLQKLLDAMNASRGKKVFFILLPGFPFQILFQAGFAYGRDFLNGFEFLSEEHGVVMNSSQLVKKI